MWILKMAWRDSRGSRRKLLLFVSSMVLGVAAIVAIQSFGFSLRRAVDEQAKTLLGADLSIESSRPFTPAATHLIDSLEAETSRRVSFTSMALFNRTGATRLVTVRALQGRYPFYGSIETEPASAAETYLSGRNALVDGTLLEQYRLRPGDSLRIGTVNYRIVGRLVKTPRESTAMMLFSPRIYIPLEHVDQQLLGLGSRADYEVYFKFPEGTDVEAVVENIKPVLDENKLGYDTVEEIKENWDEGLSNLYRFLSLVGFIALLLGGLGVASSVHVFVRQRVETVAILRCLGAKAWSTVRVYLVQAAAMGLTGAVAGSLVGIGIQALLPGLLADFLPVQVTFSISWIAVLFGAVIGLSATLLFALLPLVSVRTISPLRALRSTYEPARSPVSDPVYWLVLLLVLGALTGFAVYQAPVPIVGALYAGSIAAVLLMLALVARLIIWLARRVVPSFWPYSVRQGLANLYRPHNQTFTLMLVMGFGTFLVMTLILVQRTLLAQFDLADDEGRPNIVLFDIQPDQLPDVEKIVEGRGLPVLDVVPIVTMRLAEVHGKPVDILKEDSTVEQSWAFNHEFRSTYRDQLTESEEVVEGVFTGSVTDSSQVIPISIEQEVAADLSLGIGDTLVFNIQGVHRTTIVDSIRKVNWRRVSTNFLIVFPAGSLDQSPQFNVILTRAATATESAGLQSAVVQQYPNVSAIDLSLVLSVFDSIFSRVAFVVRFMALFSILTALIVLVGAVIVSRYQRMGESVLLKTLGASRSVIGQVMLSEYLFLGIFATFTGLTLALVAGWALARFVFDTPYVFDLLPVVVALVTVTGLTVVIGLINSRGIYNRPALEVLRTET